MLKTAAYLFWESKMADNLSNVKNATRYRILKVFSFLQLLYS